MNLTVRSPAQEAPPQRALGLLEIKFAAGPGGARLKDLRQVAPCRAFFPRVERGEPLLSVLVNVSGGLVEGDRLDYFFEAERGACVAVTTQAAEKIYRSLRAASRVRTRWRIGETAFVDWRPQETILFDGARLDRSFDADLDDGARLLAAECVLFGRLARGETFATGQLRDLWRIRRNGRLVWLDSLRLEGDVEATRTHSFGFGSAVGYVTAIYAGPEAAALLPLARSFIEQGGWRAGATFVNGLLILRALDTNEARLRLFAEAACGLLRSATSNPRGGHES